MYFNFNETVLLNILTTYKTKEEMLLYIKKLYLKTNDKVLLNDLLNLEIKFDAFTETQYLELFNDRKEHKIATQPIYKI